MSELINGRATEKILFNIRECAYGACLSECPYDSSDECVEELLKDALALIERLESERDAAMAKVPKWIDVKEQPPEFPCLYWDGINKIGITKSLATITLKSGKTVYLSDMFLIAFPDIKQSDVDSCTHILYWMPLPEPPEEGTT